MENNVKFERNWCDFLTPCKHFENVYVGDYDCTQCKYYGGLICETNIEPGQYFTVAEGCIKCNKK